MTWQLFGEVEEKDTRCPEEGWLTVFYQAAEPSDPLEAWVYWTPGTDRPDPGDLPEADHVWDLSLPSCVPMSQLINRRLEGFSYFIQHSASEEHQISFPLTAREMPPLRQSRSSLVIREAHFQFLLALPTILVCPFSRVQRSFDRLLLSYPRFSPKIIEVPVMQRFRLLKPTSDEALIEGLKNETLRAGLALEDSKKTSDFKKISLSQVGLREETGSLRTHWRFTVLAGAESGFQVNARVDADPKLRTTTGFLHNRPRGALAVDLGQFVAPINKYPYEIQSNIVFALRVSTSDINSVEASFETRFNIEKNSLSPRLDSRDFVKAVNQASYQIGSAARKIASSEPISFAPIFSPHDVDDLSFSLGWSQPLLRQGQAGFHWRVDQLTGPPVLRMVPGQMKDFNLTFPHLPNRRGTAAWQVHLATVDGTDSFDAADDDRNAIRSATGAFVWHLQSDTDRLFSQGDNILIGGFLLDAQTDGDAGKNQPIQATLWLYSQPGTSATGWDFRIHELPLTQAEPVTLSKAANRERGTYEEMPLLLPMQSPAIHPDRQFELSAIEVVSLRKPWELRLPLQRPEDARPKVDRFVLLGGAPFTFLGVFAKSLTSRSSDASTYVAEWSSKTNIWKVKNPSDIYRQRHPAQAYGESMDKPHRLHIYDNPNDDFLPAPGEATDGELQLSHVVDLALTPATDLWIRSTDTGPAGEAIPEWEVGLLFQSKGRALGSGVAIEALRAEFLYGLSVALDASLAKSVAPRAAELASLFGQLVNEEAASGSQKTYWQQLRRAIRSRLMQVDIWSPLQREGDVLFQPATLREGISFTPRHTALLAHPLTKSPEQTDVTKLLRFHKNGLRGGFLWPIESRNLLHALEKNPQSGGGELSQVSLGPMGGSAQQTAEFLGGQVKVISETRQGLVVRQRLEVLGRIAVLYHQAKHVIVYERTTNFSPQFSPEGDANRRSRRPILRKVKEYVELLQPVRQYPDKPGPVKRAGSLAEVSFANTLISVDSRWGEDLSTNAWRVPLWHRGAAVKRPQVYTQPDVLFGTYADAEEGIGHQSCTNPDNLYFYTEFPEEIDQEQADVETWFPAKGIDFPAVTATMKGPVDERRNSKDLRSSPSGYERFTWNLAPSSHKTQLNKHRADQPLYANLSSITFARADYVDTRQTQVDDLLITTPPASLDLGDYGRTAYWSGGDGAITPQIAADHKALKDILDADSDSETEVVTAIEAAIRSIAVSDDVFENISTTVNAWASNENLAGFVDKAIPIIDGIAGFDCEAVQRRLKESVGRQRAMILNAVDEVENAIRSADIDPDNIASELKMQIRKSLHLTLSGVDFNVLNIDAILAEAESALRQFELDTAATIKRGNQRIDELFVAFESGKANWNERKPWSQARLEEFRRQREKAAQRCTAEVEELIADLNKRITTQLGVPGERLALWLRRGVNNVAKQAHADDGAIAQYKALVTATFADLQNLIPRKPTFVQSSLMRLTTWIEGETNNEKKQKLERAQAALQGIEANADELRRQVGVNLDLARQRFLKEGDAAAGAITSAAEQSRANISRYQSDYLAILEDISVADGFSEAQANLVSQWNANFSAGLTALTATLEAYERSEAQWMQAVLLRIRQYQAQFIEKLSIVEDLTAQVRPLLGDLRNHQRTIDELVKPNHIVEAIGSKIVDPLVDRTLARFNNEITDSDIDAFLSRFRKELNSVLVDGGGIDALVNELSKLCDGIVTPLQNALKVEEWLNLAERKTVILAHLEKYKNNLGDIATLKRHVRTMQRDFERINNDLQVVNERVESYTDRVVQEASQVFKGGGNLGNNAMRLISTLGNPPELPNLSYARERVRYYYDTINEVVDLTPIESALDGLGDDIKSMQLTPTIKQLSDQLIPDLSNKDLNKVVSGFAGLKFDGLFSGVKLPKLDSKAVRITHDYDKKTHRAWAQADVDLPMPNRNTLFEFGPFQVDFLKAHLTGQLRIDASVANPSPNTQSSAILKTDMDVVVGGQSMVMFRDFSIRHADGAGLSFNLDPNKIELNPTLKTVNDVLSQLFPDEIGGMEVIKNGGLPVGLRYQFATPPISLAYGTTGISNLSFANDFRVLAYPDFVLTNRFSISSPERPFIFAVWILGGAGWINIDSSYRPLESELRVSVSVSVGASAFVGFAFAGVTGSVYFVYAATIKYQKLIGHSGGGLTIGLVIVVAGNVDVLGIAHAYLGVILRLTHNANGDIDANGRLSIKIRISRWFKIKVKSAVTYKMSGGKSKTSTRTSVETQRMLRNRRAAS